MPILRLTFQCIDASKIDGYIAESDLVCPSGYKSVIAEPMMEFLEFDREALFQGFYSVLLAFAIGFGVGLIISQLRKLR